MADAANTFVTLDTVHDCIVSSIKSAMPAFQTVEEYRLDRKTLPCPACLIELQEFSGDGGDPGTGQLAIVARFSAYIIVPFRQPDAKRMVRTLAGDLAVLARLNRWGCPIGPANVIGGYQDDFGPELSQYECWRVEFEHEINLGPPSADFKTDGLTAPNSASYAFTPNTGSDFESWYSDIAGHDVS